MAEGKKGFILYADYQESFEELSNEDAGQLIKHILKYVNDENPETDNKIVKISFIPIKLQLKRDLKLYEKTKAGRSKAGKASAKARRLKREQNPTNSTSVESVQQSSTNPTVIVNDTVKVNVIDNVIVIDNEKVINEWIVLNCDGFSEELKQWIEIIEAKYNNQTSIIQIESWLRLLNGWYKTNDYKKECLNKHIAGPWKTLNFVKVEELNSTYKKQTSKDFEL